MKSKGLRWSVVFLVLTLTQTVWAKDYRASVFGIKSDGVTLNTRSIQKAVDFISENGGGKLVFYVGRYLTGTITLKSNVTIQLEEGAILVGTPSIYDYYTVDGMKALIVANNQQNIGITGKGVIDGQGTTVLEQINNQISKGYMKETALQASPALIAMDSCRQVTFSELNMVNACGNVQTYSGCRELTIRDVTVKSSVVADSKGLVLSECNGVKLSKIYFETSGKECVTDGKSKNITADGCKNEMGKTVSAKN